MNAAGIITVMATSAAITDFIIIIIIYLRTNLVLILNFNMRWIAKCSIAATVAIIRLFNAAIVAVDSSHSLSRCCLYLAYFQVWPAINPLRQLLVADRCVSILLNYCFAVGKNKSMF